MINVRFNPKTCQTKQLLRLFNLAQASNQTIRLNTPRGSYYLESSQKRNMNLNDKQILENKYHRSKRSQFGWY